jgi:hypothetical protein
MVVLTALAAVAVASSGLEDAGAHADAHVTRARNVSGGR